MIENDLAFNSKKKLYSYVQYIKLVIGSVVAIYSISILKLNKFDFYTPYISSAMVFSGFFAIVLMKKMDKLLRWSPYVVSSIDVGVFWVSIIVSGFIYNTIFLWCAGLIVMTYLFTSFKFALAQVVATISFVLFWVVSGYYEHSVIATDESYAAAFIISTIANLTFVFSMFHFSQKIQIDYNEKLINAKKDIEKINTFPLLNPNPIFEYNNAGELEPKNKIARQTVLYSNNEELKSLIKLSNIVLKSKKHVSQVIKMEDFHYMVNGIYVNNKVNLYLTDVTELLETKEEIEKKEQYNRAIIDAIPGFVSWIDSDYKYLGVNDHMCEFFDKQQNEFVGKSIGEIANDQENIIARLAKELFSTDIDLLQHEFSFHFNDQEFWSYITLKKYNDGKNAILVSTDITSLKEAEKQILDEQKRSEASAKLASFGEMAAGIAHEINNPLALLNGVGFRMKKLNEKGMLSEEKLLDNIDKLTEGIERIQKIARGVKNLAREGTNDPFEFATIKDILDDSLVLLSKKCSHNNINLIIPEYPGELGFDCQRVQISQIVVIMINNAIDAIENLDEKWIKIEFLDHNSEVQFQITDSGGGIPDEIAQKIFDPFYTTKGVGKGTGLGLSLASKIVNLHQGRFELDSDCENTRFVLVFPKSLGKSAA